MPRSTKANERAGDADGGEDDGGGRGGGGRDGGDSEDGRGKDDGDGGGEDDGDGPCKAGDGSTVDQVRMQPSVNGALTAMPSSPSLSTATSGRCLEMRSCHRS